MKSDSHRSRNFGYDDQAVSCSETDVHDAAKRKKTYNSRYLPVVTYLAIDLLIYCLNRANHLIKQLA